MVGLLQAVEQLHSCRAVLRESAPVKEESQGSAVWEGTVQVFDLEGHPQATRCYAWPSPTDSEDRDKIFGVLHIPPIDSPQKAVRAAIIREFRSQDPK